MKSQTGMSLRQGGNLRLTLFYLIVVAIMYLTLSAQAQVPRQTGIGLVWGGQDEEAILKYPYVCFGQGAFLWKNIQPRENEYDWSVMDATLKRFYDLGKKVPIQVNTPCPEWIFKYVASVGSSRGGQAPQYWDPVYFGFLSNFVKAYAEHLGTSPYKDAVLFIRMQFNALNTEILSFDSGYLQGTASPDRKKWTLPPNGHVYTPDLTPAIETEMIQKITQLYLDHFFPHHLPVALRMDGENDLTKPGRGVDGQAIYDRWTSNPLAWSMTTHYGIGLIASPESFRFKRRCRERGTTAFAEQFALISSGRAQHSEADVARAMRQVNIPGADGKPRIREPSPEQAFYWTTLMLLDWGFSYISLYGVDHTWAHADATAVHAMEFVNKYAGWHGDPAHAPGAWTTLGRFVSKRGAAENANWGFFVTQENPKASTEPVNFAGGETAAQGVWARRLTSTASFVLDSAFAASLDEKSFVRIVWLNEPGAALRVSAGGKDFAAMASDASGKWKETWVEIPADVFGKSGNSRLVVDPAKGKPVLHLIEICRKRTESAN